MAYRSCGAVSHQCSLSAGENAKAWRNIQYSMALSAIMAWQRNNGSVAVMAKAAAA
jgi:hypothetical protein